ncbi:ankyrin repeat domain-containing protein [Candidatus Mesenet endosymbiont of Agriotes lineatus]
MKKGGYVEASDRKSESLLNEHKSIEKINVRDEDWNTPLHIAVKKGI